MFQPSKLTTKAEKHTKTTLDTLELTPPLVCSWELPPFQRQKNVNDRVRQLAEQIREDGGVIPGVLTLGVLNGITYLIDGQHRRESFLISGMETGYADVRIHYFESMAQMGEEYVRLNSQLVRMRPDDILRGLEQTSPAVVSLRERCPFIGYDYLRRNESSPIMSMSAALRAWKSSAADAPSGRSCGTSAVVLVQSVTVEEASTLADFMTLAMAAWGKDDAYARLWNGLNLTLCMWLYRRLVLTQYSYKTQKMPADLFAKCLMALSTNGNYLDWLAGRRLSERDRSPTYLRIRASFVERVQAETGKRINMPAPEWSSR